MFVTCKNPAELAGFFSILAVSQRTHGRRQGSFRPTHKRPFSLLHLLPAGV